MTIIKYFFEYLRIGYPHVESNENTCRTSNINNEINKRAE
jgi:hypothetical protein